MENFWEHLQNLTDAQSILSSGGFYLLLIVVYAETGLFFGFFLPGDYLLFLAGLLSAAGIIHVPIYTLVLSLIGAGILGNYTGYWFGYRTGPVLFSKNDSFFFKKRYITVAEAFYAKYGGMALILGRFFPIVRTFAPIFAGVVKVDIKKFTVYNIIGSVAWVTTLTLAGYFLGKRFPELKDYLQYIVLGLIIITTIPLIIAFVKRQYEKSKDE
ncbi:MULTISPECIES: VTT domain-containing protein [unclassified Mucilaginibacter]|uniref:DedA family protein n=1 Tax=unclassified Mucilaginibacter TaxID=2617802 RepID=UPI002AC8CECD|nr:MULTISPECIES: VTT domain-containing protein [unclassified Mucilaginibacter]MEB0262150.1 VTT domain-containing protein [Mucilaginibacter sp. 10I4]MEB0279811.1 VTT domain-containing protein [Mucilaginibacter sp. 10B2]MEB0301237.1 VTT domain-containing protein [Mucilaginibacter sp. 5C4]WPX24217.1 VTT domain-containing protein [Mucilaginibacter sp. 5C4]